MKADILNKQFDSVFSRPQPLSLNQSCKQLLTPQNHPKIPNVNITEEGVKKLLKGLNPSKSLWSRPTVPKVIERTSY
jgi:hypothetical protein